MRIGSRILIAMAVVLFLVSNAGAADDIPNLVGKWVSEYKVFSPSGSVESTNVLTVTEQDGPYFRGNHYWKIQKGSPENVATQRGQVVYSEKEPIVGVIDFDGKTLRIVEKGDTGRFDGRLAAPKKMELVHTEGGNEAFVYRAVFTKQAD